MVPFTYLYELEMLRQIKKTELNYSGKDFIFFALLTRVSRFVEIPHACILRPGSTANSVHVICFIVICPLFDWYCIRVLK